MEEIKIVDKYMDEREFRNYVNTMFYKHNYSLVGIDDTRLSDKDKENDNDILVSKNNITYTVQTYLNTKIGKKEIEDTLKDFEKEKVINGIIVTNYTVNNDIKDEALTKNIIILDRKDFENGIYNK